MKRFLSFKTFISILGLFIYSQSIFSQAPVTAAPVPGTYNPYRILTVFSDVNDQKPFTDFFNMNADTTETKLVLIGEDKVLEYKNFSQITMVMEKEYNIKYMKFVHVDIYPLESFDVYVKPLSKFRNRWIDAVDTVTLVANQWNSLDIPIENIKRVDNGQTIVLDRFNAFRLEKDTLTYPTIYVDNVYVYDDFVDTQAPVNYKGSVAGKTNTSVILSLSGQDNSGELYYKVAYNDKIDTLYALSDDTIMHVVGGLTANTAYAFKITAYDNDGNIATAESVVNVTTYAEEPSPATAAPVPAYEANTVISIFSDKYNDACPLALGMWNQQTIVETVKIGDDNIWKWYNFNYQGIEINGNSVGFNAKSCDGLQMNVWSANAPSMEVYIISQSKKGKFQSKVIVDLKLEQWNTVKIPMADFLASQPKFEPDSIIQFKFQSPDHSAKLPLDDVVFIDNLLFYGGHPDSINTVGGGGGGAATELPLSFESGEFSWTNFDGGMVTVIDNTQKSGINTSDKVAKMVKGAGQPWAGSYITLESPVDFTISKTFKMKVFTPKVGTKVLLKVENLTNPAIAFEKEVLTTKGNEWEELTFDYSGVNTANQYHKVVVIFDLGTMGDGSANFTYMFDDIMLEGMVINPELVLPVDFESTVLTYTFTNFDGGQASVIANPDASGVNTSGKVAKMIKGAGQPWAGAYLTLDKAIDFSGSKTFKMKVWAPKIGTKVLLKVENGTTANINYEVSTQTTKANEWEELTFDYSGVDATKEYHKIVIIFDLGTMGDGSANFTYYFDDIRLDEPASSIKELGAFDMKVISLKNGIEVAIKSPTRVNVYSVTGRLVYSGICESTLQIPLSQGVYIVNAGNKSIKCLVQ